MFKVRSLVLLVIFLFVFSASGFSLGRLLKRSLEFTELENIGSIPSLVSDDYDEKANRYYKRLMANDTIAGDDEMLKIMYLIEELRQSPYKFERNGEIHTSVRAAQHLMMKYNRTKDRIKTAEDFIELLASKSSKTGRSYYVIFDDRLKIPSKAVLSQELQKLNLIRQTQKIN